MEGLLNEGWLDLNVPDEKLDTERTQDILKNLSVFHKQTVFQTGVVSFIQGFMSTHEELEEIEEMFLKLDTSHDGFLSPDELRQGMSLVLGPLKANETDFLQIVEALDINKDGKIDFAEYTTAAIDRRVLLS
jgi:Ca2+-binding EF-hand superfamily protein